MSFRFPDAFTGRLAGQDYADSPSLLKALDEPSPVSIRLNWLKWQDAPPGADPVAWCDSGYYLVARPSFTSDPLFHAGCYYVQEASSMFLGQVIRQIGGDRPGLRILDLSAAPGGKTTHLAAMAGKGTVIIANEVIRARASVLVENVTKWGSGNVIVTGSDPSAFGRLQSYFDIIVVDAPCSGEGMFREEAVRTQWSEQVCSLSAARQRRILSDVWPALKEGGHLIYSTCTFNPDENEGQVARFIADRGASVVAIEGSGNHGIIMTGTKDESMGLGFHPGRIRGEGFFISLIRKEESSGNAAPVTRPARPVSSGRQVPDSLLRVAKDWYAGEAVSVEDFSGSIVVLPLPAAEYRRLSGVLKIYKAGTALLSLRKDKIVPHHDLAMSAYFRRDALPQHELSPAEALKYLSRSSDTGWGMLAADRVAVTFRGVVLGFVKNLGSRINNYYPLSWRIVREGMVYNRVL